MAYAEKKIPQGDMIRNTRITDCSEQDGIVVLQCFDTVFRHHFSVFEIILTSPRIFREMKGKASVKLGCSVQDTYGLQYHFRSDTVSRDEGNLICIHDHDSCAHLC